MECGGARLAPWLHEAQTATGTRRHNDCTELDIGKSTQPHNVSHTAVNHHQTAFLSLKNRKYSHIYGGKSYFNGFSTHKRICRNNIPPFLLKCPNKTFQFIRRHKNILYLCIRNITETKVPTYFTIEIYIIN